MSNMKMTSKTKKAEPIPDFASLPLDECMDCLCYQFRKTSRIVINFYDDALKSADLKSNQFLILVAVAFMKSTNFKTLAEFLGIDQSTRVRLPPLAKGPEEPARKGRDRKVARVEGGDGRSRRCRPRARLDALHGVNSLRPHPDRQYRVRQHHRTT